MEMKTIGNNNKAAEDEDEGIYGLAEEIQAEIAHFKRKQYSNFNEFHMFIARTLMPYLHDIAHYVRENTEDIDRLIALQEDETTTQFTEEDAPKFDLVLQFAQGMAKQMIDSGSLQGDELQKVVAVHATATDCLSILEKSVVHEDDDEEDEGTEDAEDDESEQN